jgi:hypothetical protein
MKIILNEQDINRLMAMLGELPYKNVNPIVTFLETKVVQPEPEQEKE